MNSESNPAVPGIPRNDQFVAAINGARVPFAEWRKRHGASCQSGGKVVQGDFRKQIIGPSGRALSEYARELGQYLAAEPLYMRAGEVWELAGGQLRKMKAERFCTWIERHVSPVSWEKNAKGENELKPRSIGCDTALKILAARDFHEQLREIKRVSLVPLPVWREDGAGLDLLPAGYSPRHQTLVLESVEIDEAMSAGDAALWLRDELLKEFPLWPDDHHRSLSAIVAMMLMPFCELLVPQGAQRPVFIVTANAERSGKTLLARLAIVPVFGRAKITAPPLGTASESLEKKLFALALAGAPYVFFDNWKGKIESGALEGFITAAAVEDRVLQQSEVRSVDKNTLVFITGNKAEVSDDMRGRAIVVELFVQEAEAERRVLKNWMDENTLIQRRPKILSALYAIARDWAARGPRPSSSVKHGTFNEWGEVIGAMLESVGFVSPLSPPRLRHAVNPDLEAFEVLLPLLLDEVGSDVRLLSSAEVMQRARELGGFSFLDEEPPDEESPNGAKAARQERGIWGKCVERFVDRRFRSGCKMEWTERHRQRRKLRISRGPCQP